MPAVTWLEALLNRTPRFDVPPKPFGVFHLTALGKPGDDYPVTHARHHKNLQIVSDYGTAQKPRFNI